MKNALLIFCLFTGSIAAHCQRMTAYKASNPKNIAWFTPSGATKINGLSVGIQAFNVNNAHLKINGVNADLGMLSMMALPYLLDYYFTIPRKRTPEFMDYDTTELIVNGISLSMGGELGVSINGLNVAGLVTGGYQLNGISITGGFTRVRNFRGITISGLVNHAKSGIGLQLALFNQCEKLKGLQVGLWNKSGKRSLPLLNWGW